MSCYCCVQVTTKKGYDGCRKAEYLFAHQPITDKTFATLGETTISNLKSTFEGVETGVFVCFRACLVQNNTHITRDRSVRKGPRTPHTCLLYSSFDGANQRAAVAAADVAIGHVWAQHAVL